MPDPRTFVWFGRHAGARFRCRVCRRFVRATDRGVCSTCGMPPAEFTPVTRGAGSRPPVVQGEPPSWRDLRVPGLGYAVLVGLAILTVALMDLLR